MHVLIKHERHAYMINQSWRICGFSEPKATERWSRPSIPWHWQEKEDALLVLPSLADVPHLQRREEKGRGGQGEMEIKGQVEEDKGRRDSYRSTDHRRGLGGCGGPTWPLLVAVPPILPAEIETETEMG